MIAPLTNVEVERILHGSGHWLDVPEVPCGLPRAILSHELRSGDYPGAVRWITGVDDGERVWVPVGVVTR